MLIFWYLTKDLNLTTSKNPHTKVYKQSQIFVIYDWFMHNCQDNFAGAEKWGDIQQTVADYLSSLSLS